VGFFLFFNDVAARKEHLGKATQPLSKEGAAATMPVSMEQKSRAT